MAELNPQQSKSVIELYEYRVKALLKKIDFLEAQLEISKQFNFKFQNYEQRQIIRPLQKIRFIKR